MKTITTYSGREIDPLNLKQSDIDIHDVAWSLSKIVRYGGHAIYDITVAQHSVELSRAVPAWLARAAFAHDWSEYVLYDLISPVKDQVSGYSEIENRAQITIFRALGIPFEDLAAIEPYDHAIRQDEKMVLWHGYVPPADKPPLGVTIHPWEKRYAHDMFLRRYFELFVNGTRH